MEHCPAALESLCELTGYFPHFTQTQVGAFLFGVLVVVIFSVDHYKVPTYAKTTIGEFIELAPESLTSSSRYAKGLYVYIALMLAFYSTLLILGPATVGSLISYLGSKIEMPKDTALWPLAATSIITMIGSSNDRYLGRLEYWLRSIGHEAAYIPEAVTNLASSLDGSFPLTQEALEIAGEDTEEARNLIDSSQEGARQSWIRAKYLYARLEQLRKDDQFKGVMKLPENERAFKFVTEQRDVLAGAVAEEITADAAKRIDALKSALAVFLASILWRGSESEVALRAKLSSLNLNYGTEGKYTTGSFMVHLFSWLAGGAAIWLLFFQLRRMQTHETSAGQIWYLTLACVLLFLTAFFVNRWREKRLRSGEWRYDYDAILRCTIVCLFGAGILSALITFVIQQGGYPTFLAMLLVGLVMGLLCAVFFQHTMRVAAKSRPTTEAVESGIASSGTLNSLRSAAVLAGGSSGVASFLVMFLVLYWISQIWIVMGAPQLMIESAEAELEKVSKAHIDPKKEDEWFTRNYAQTRAAGRLRLDLDNLKSHLNSNDIGTDNLTKIIADCAAAGKLDENKSMFDANCELNNEVTQRLPIKSGVLQSLILTQFQIRQLKETLPKLTSYTTLLSAFRFDWKNALIVSLIWGTLTALFAIAALLYRRQMLWDGVNARMVSKYIPRAEPDPAAWLCKPLFELGNVTPLEALHYPALRARLADYSRVAPPEPVRPQLRAVV